MNWQKLAAARTMLLCLLGFLAIAAGVTMYNIPAGVIVAGVLACVFAYLTDTSQPASGRTR